MEIIAIDLGSNSLRVLKYDCKNRTVKGEFEKTVGTADGLIQSGNISSEALDRIISALQESREKLNYELKNIFAVTTQAMRMAKNRIQILEKIKNDTGINFHIIDPQKEADLTLLAIRYAMDRHKISHKEFMLLDIGGGSTELILVSNTKKIAHSFPFGIVTLTQSKNYQSDFLNFKTEVIHFLSLSHFDTKKVIFISTAGTPTTLCAVHLGMNSKTYDKNKINGYPLNLTDVLKVQKDFLTFSPEVLEEKVGSGRIQYINTGVEIFKLFFEVLKKESSLIFDDGLRDGVAIEFCFKNKWGKIT